MILQKFKLYVILGTYLVFNKHNNLYKLFILIAQ